MKRLWKKASKKAGGPVATGRPRRRRILVGAGVVVTGVAGLWGALHVFPAFGPAMADGARAVLGPGAVAWAEDTVYGVEDRIKRVIYRDAAPKTFWEPPVTLASGEVEPPAPPPTSEVASTPSCGSIAASVFSPPSYEPPAPRVAGPGDGRWIAIADPGAPGERPTLFKSLVHPDPARSYAAVAIVAVDLTRLDLTFALGTTEPRSAVVAREQRPGLIPRERLPDLVAAFNGGFKVEHGHYGAMVDGQTLLPPRDLACTVALLASGGVEIRSWPALKEREGQMRAYRQTPPCLVEQGSVNDRLQAVDDSKGWGAAVGGETVIRRSAVGVDATGRTLFYGFGDSVTAGALARAMKAAGAENAAQLDVNGLYPRFLFYTKAAPGEVPVVASALVPDTAFVRQEYVGHPEGRDFFYLTRKPASS